MHVTEKFKLKKKPKTQKPKQKQTIKKHAKTITENVL